MNICHLSKNICYLFRKYPSLKWGVWSLSLEPVHIFCFKDIPKIIVRGWREALFTPMTQNCRFSTETFWRLVFSHEWFISNGTKSSWRWILNHECENISLQNDELENCVLSHHIIVRYIGNLAAKWHISPPVCPESLSRFPYRNDAYIYKRHQ